MTYQRLISFIAVALLMITLPDYSMAADPMNGQTLFLEKCASCHNNNMVDDMTGPALYGVQDRWKKYGDDLYEWVRNSQALVSADHPYAKPLFAKWNGSVMTPFPDLDNAAIDDILTYIANKGEFGCAAPPCEITDGGGTTASVSEGEETSPWLGYSLLVVLLVAVALLGRYINSLTRLAQQNKGKVVASEKSVMDILFGPAVIRVLVFAVVMYGGYTTVNNAIGLGRQVNYEPTQPINFSHKIHAGDNGIDCQYCHDGARRSKHSVIPASNTCINCHANIQKGSKDGTKELIKVYAASGFNPLTNSYLPKGMAAEERAAVYKKWLKKVWSKEYDKDEEGTREMIDEQLASVEGTYAKPIEWVRIHNLPDHVYFNHSQHVSVGKIECQTCHGQVEEMDVVKQHSPLSMGWCINCHRQTEVQFRDGMNEGKGSPYAGDANTANAYYTDYKYYEKYHEELKDGDRNGVTVEEIGGLECQKCHY